MTKAEMIAKHGEEYYEKFKAKCRRQAYERYCANPEKVKANHRKSYARHREKKTEYSKGRNIIYRINSRDANRIAKMGILEEGQEAHHLKYHADKNDDAWMDDVVIMSREEHRRWHRNHPEFNALDHVI